MELLVQDLPKYASSSIAVTLIQDSKRSLQVAAEHWLAIKDPLKSKCYYYGSDESQELDGLDS